MINKVSSLGRHGRSVIDCRQSAKPTGFRLSFQRFQNDESGAVTVDYTVLSSIIVVLGLSVSQPLLGAATDFVEDFVSFIETPY